MSPGLRPVRPDEHGALCPCDACLTYWRAALGFVAQREGALAEVGQHFDLWLHCFREAWAKQEEGDPRLIPQLGVVRLPPSVIANAYEWAWCSCSVAARRAAREMAPPVASHEVVEKARERWLHLCGLAGSPNPHEAQLARQRAEEVAAQWGFGALP